MDLDILIWINENWHNNVILNKVMKVITTLSDYGIIWIIVGITLLLFKKTRFCGIVLLIGFCIITITNYLIKFIISRPRPFLEDVGLLEFLESINMDLPSSSSFPSGHTFISFFSATIITLFHRKGWISYILAIFIAFSRVFLCVHYLSDVLSGVGLGVLFAIIIYLICKQKKYHLKK